MGIIRKLSGKIVFFKRKRLIGSRCKVSIHLDDEFTFKTGGNRKVGKNIIIHEIFFFDNFHDSFVFALFYVPFLFFLGRSDSTG